MDKYIKSPLNYMGGKFKLLGSILPYFPKEIDTFVEPFGGGLNVGLNVKANKIVYNDIEPHVVDLIKELRENENFEREIDKIILKYNLSKENKEGFLKLREDYNKSPNSTLFYCLICYSFNNGVRFNQNGEYNMPFGKDRSSFNTTLRKRFNSFVKELKEKEIEILNKSFEDIDYSGLTKNDLVYCDPPYLNAVATYNEKNGWTKKEEIKLLALLDKLNDSNIKFALSNNLKYNHELIEKWIKKYRVIYLNADYSNCNYQKVDKSKGCEILVLNY